MQNVKCPFCSYRNMGNDDICANCGASLPLFPSAGKLFLQPDDIFPSSQPMQKYAKPPDDGALPLVLSQTGYEPYDIADPEFADSPSKELLSTLVSEMPATLSVGAPKGNLPWGYPRRPPDIEGAIIQTQADQEILDYPSPLHAIGSMLIETLWAISSQSHQRESERILVTTLRIRTSSGDKKDARLMGFLRGASLSLGDTVSLWGWKRRGSLMVRLGYNHTTKAKIITHATSGMRASLAALIIFCLVIGVLIYWSIASGLWAPLFSLLKKP